MILKVRGELLLKNKAILNYLAGLNVKKIEWMDGSISDESGQDTYLEKVNNSICIVNGVAPTEITAKDIIYVDIPQTEIYNTFTATEAALLWGKNEGTIRKAIQYGLFEEGKDYRKSGNTTLISREAMERRYGKLAGEE